jgi:hypothetical protein
LEKSGKGNFATAMSMRWTCVIGSFLFFAMGNSPTLGQRLPRASLGLPVAEKIQAQEIVADIPAPDPQPKGRFQFEASWDNGLFFATPDDQFRFHAGGIGQIDTVWLIGPKSEFAAPGGAANGVGNAQATALRRAILQVDGTMVGQFDYMIQFDFANESNDNSGLQPLPSGI